MWYIFLFPFKIWLTTCQRSNLRISTGEGWEEVSLSKLKQAERVTSPLCPERCIIGWDGLIDAILTTSPPLSLHSPSRDVWKDFLLFLPHLSSCCAYHHHSTPISWPVDLENMLERHKFPQISYFDIGRREVDISRFLFFPPSSVMNSFFSLSLLAAVYL